ncbi:MAG: hypothetical protein EBQ82_13110 [Betaproteobacteria bacterium]|nr:hypothetical protein [Betaproteobacteria bacterium]NBY06294.1 hypothetical protein [Betaproteobacteria bacterium]
MKITGVSINRPLNKAQGAIRKISAVTKPLTLGVTEVPGPSTPDADTDVSQRPSQKAKDNLDTLGTEVDVWA